MNNFLLDAFVLTYNRDEYLGLMLDSILNQTYQNFNLYVLDNASADNTKDVVESFKIKRNIHYIRHSKNIGYTANMNLGFELSTLKYFVILHDDDTLHENYFSEMINLMESKPEVAMASCGMEGIDNNGIITIKDVFNLDSDIVYRKGQFIKDYCFGKNFIGCPTVIFRKSYFLENNIKFRNDVGPATDTFLWFLVSDLGGIIYVYNKILYKYRYHETQGSKVDDIELFSGLYKKMKEFLSNDYRKEIELFRVRYSLTIRKNIFKRLVRKEVTIKQFLISQKNLKKSGLSKCLFSEILKFEISELLRKVSKHSENNTKEAENAP